MATQTIAAAACYEIPLTGGRVALVDAADYLELSLREWHCSRHNGTIIYAVSSGRAGAKQAQMHRVIMSPKPGQVVDHINGDGLDNRRANLRVCTHKENIRNRRKLSPAASKFKGVRRSSAGGWRVEIVQNGERLHLGTFQDEERAARQYDRAARTLFGQFALTNEMMGAFDPRLNRFTRRSSPATNWPSCE